MTYQEIRKVFKDNKGAEVVIYAPCLDDNIRTTKTEFLRIISGRKGSEESGINVEYRDYTIFIDSEF